MIEKLQVAGCGLHFSGPDKLVSLMIVRSAFDDEYEDDHDHDGFDIPTPIPLY